MDQGWAGGNWWAAANPSVANNEHYQAWWARYLRAAASPSMRRGARGLNAGLDIRHLLPKVDVPTLVIHRTHEPPPISAMLLRSLMIGPCRRRQPSRQTSVCGRHTAAFRALGQIQRCCLLIRATLDRLNLRTRPTDAVVAGACWRRL